MDFTLEFCMKNIINLHVRPGLRHLDDARKQLGEVSNIKEFRWYVDSVWINLTEDEARECNGLFEETSHVYIDVQSEPGAFNKYVTLNYQKIHNSEAFVEPRINFDQVFRDFLAAGCPRIWQI